MTAFHFTPFIWIIHIPSEFEMKKENEKNQTQTQTKESSGIIRSTKKEFKAKKREIKRYHSSIAKSNRKEKREKLAELKTERESALIEAYGMCGKEPPRNPPKRSILEEIGNSVTHGLGSIFSVIALLLMLFASDTPEDYAGAIIYFVGAFIMFTMSCLYHAFRHGSTVKRLFRRFDYSCIYLLIGATFAPPLLSVVGGVFGTVFFIVQWAVIIFGITIVGVFGPTKFRKLHIPLYVILGWSALMLMPSLISSSFALAMWILAGGVIYSVGIIPFVMKSPVSHFIWHFFVLAGAVVQWIGIYQYIYV